MRIAFNENCLSVRGTSIALFDYAYYNQTILGNESIIIYDTTHHANSDLVLEKFKKHFPVFGYNDFSQAEKIVRYNGCDAAFFIKGGKNDGRYFNGIKSLIMAVGICDQNDIHGDVYTFCSKWLHDYCKIGAGFVPHMINLPEVEGDMRAELGIPENATVFGRTGGLETFDIQFVKDIIPSILEARPDVYFLFQYTNKFYDHPRVIHLDASADPVTKVKFINTSDAMLHARYQGESFGIANGEFSSKNKRVITYFDSPERNHIEILGDKGIYFRNKEEITDILLNFDRNIQGDYNCYTDYTPEKVMKKFREVYGV